MNETGDLLMMFVLNGNPIPAEGLTDLMSASTIPNPLLQGFVAEKCFEIDSFSFKSGTAGDDPSTTHPPANPTDPNNKTETKPPRNLRGGYQAWRSGKNHAYPVDLKPITFTRSIESSSAILVQSCIDCVPFDSATLVKRKPAGGVSAGEAYLRLDFTGVLVTGVDWRNGDDVKETCTFICRGVTIGYRPQLPNGSLGAVISSFWSMVRGIQQVTYR
jgi:hypothetical protein